MRVTDRQSIARTQPSTSLSVLREPVLFRLSLTDS